MNWDTVKGNWTQMKGRVKERWSKLTDDDVNRIEGRFEQLAGKIQEKYGKSREDAEREINEFCGSC
ncbi:MAG: CsbD family protein [Phycisphaerae bacterium]|nr:CsbD family protein [Phycisphaerae bacterium]